MISRDAFFHNTFDQTCQHWINREHISPFLDWFMASITSFAVWFPIILIIALIAFIWGGTRIRLMLVTFLITLACVDGLVIHGIKRTVKRPRPLQVEPGVRRVDLRSHHKLPILGLFEKPKVTYPETPPPGTPVEGGSFPSAHTANNMAAAVVLYRFYHRFGIFSFIVAIIIAYSRLYVGAHWPIDVLVGGTLGGLGAWVFTGWINMAWKKYAPKFFPKLAEEVPHLF